VNRPRRCFVGERVREGGREGKGTIDMRWDPVGGTNTYMKRTWTPFWINKSKSSLKSFVLFFSLSICRKRFFVSAKKKTLLSLSSLINLPFYFYFYFSSYLPKQNHHRTPPSWLFYLQIKIIETSRSDDTWLKENVGCTWFVYYCGVTSCF